MADDNIQSTRRQLYLGLELTVETEQQWDIWISYIEYVIIPVYLYNEVTCE